MWGVGLLTWNDPATCRLTLAALAARLALSDRDVVLVLDNGSDEPFTADPAMPVTIVRQPTNLGAGGGMSATVTELLRRNAEYLLFLEDDWQLVRALALVDLQPLIAAPDVGQLRLGVRATHPAQKYYTYGLEGTDAEAAAVYSITEHIPYAGAAGVYGTYQRIRSLWSNNPFACTRAVAERFLLTGLDETRMARPYYASGLTTLSTTPGHFQHLGEIRDRRGKAGWQR